MLHSYILQANEITTLNGEYTYDINYIYQYPCSWSYIVKDLHENKINNSIPSVFIWAGHPLPPILYTFRDAKAALRDNENNLYFVEWSLAKV